MTDLERVSAAVREAAAEAIERGAATVRVTTVAQLYGPDNVYDAPVVVLTPRKPHAAEIRIEVEEGVWYLSAGGGVPYEFWGDETEWIDTLRALVAAVVAGRYELRWGESRRWLSRRRLHHCTATFETAGDPISTRHFGVDPPPDGAAVRRFEPY